MAVTAAAAVVVVLAACGSGAGGLPSGVSLAGAAVSSSAPASGSRTLSETGSSLMAPLFALWAPAYHARFSQVTLRTASSSPGEGISSAAAGKADIGASDAFLSPATLAKYPHLVNIPLAVAALMVVYNVPGISASAHLRLGGTVLARIFSGKISSSVKSAPGAIGYVGVSYLSQVMSAHEREAALGNSSGHFVLPTARALQAALASFTNTPASETIWLVNGSAAQAWAVTSGTEQLVKVNFQPLPPSIITLSDAQIAKIKG
jgi:phosphate transport system substrate-binding protein